VDHTRGIRQTKVHATNKLVREKREIPELVRWYIADRLLKSTERLNELLDGRVKHWVDEMRTIRGKTRLTWRILRDLNRAVFAFPERLAYESYHVVLDVRLWRRWQHLQAGACRKCGLYLWCFHQRYEHGEPG
jgi:hypothetical protein